MSRYISPEERERFRRASMHDGFKPEHLERLRGAKVLLAGIGGLGGEIAYSLVGAGVGELVLVHSGPLTETNLNRQTLMKESAIGSSRVYTAAERLMEYSRFCKVTAHDIDITRESILPLLDGVDLLIDARHNFPERRTLGRAAAELGIPFLFAAMDGLEAQAALFIPEENGCLDCLYPDDPPDWDPFGFPVFGATAHAIGGIASLEAIKLLSRYMEPSMKLIYHDFVTNRSSLFPLRKVNGCATCGDSGMRMTAIA